MTRKTKKIRAGQIVRYKDQEWHGNWEPLNVHNLDCAPNCFCLLGYSDWDTSNELARRTPQGIHHSKVIELLDHAYGRGHEWKHITRKNPLTKYLRNNDATLAGIDSLKGVSGHYFVVLKNKYGNYAIDAQTGITWQLDKYINLMGFNKGTLYIVYSPHVSLTPSDYNKVTMEIVTKCFPDVATELDYLKKMGYRTTDYSQDELLEHLKNMGYSV